MLSPRRVLVYQMGKVGSQSISRSLEESGLSESVIHVHWLSKNLDERVVKLKAFGQLPLPTGIWTARRLRKALSAGRPYLIISGVRDPIGREISNAFETPFISGLLRRDEYSARYLGFPGQMSEARQQIDPHRALAVLSTALNKRETYDYALQWFDRELYSMLGIDVFKYPFDRQSGWSVIEAGGCRVLVLCVERLTELFSSVVSEFVSPGSKLEMVSTNVRQESSGADAYRHVLSRIRIDPEICEYVYSSLLVRHFYTEDTRTEWTRKWTRSA